MEALQPPVGGLPLQSHAARRSFADVLAAKSSSSSPSSHSYDTGPLQMGLHKGQPAAFFTDRQLQGLSSQYSWSLVGKFSQGFNKQDPQKGRPSLEKLHQYFLSLDFKGEFSIGLLDNRHVVIHLSTEMDYLRLYSRMVWYIGTITMRVFRWSPYFRVDKESPLVPVWITMPRLPIMLFEKQTLFSLASLIGHPLRRDEATVHLKRPSVARIQVELDLLKPRPHQIWIGLGESDGYWQRIEYESLPEYCQICWHVGHSESFCRVKHPELKAKVTEPTPLVGKQPPAPRNNLIYKPKSAPQVPTPAIVPELPKEQGEFAILEPEPLVAPSVVPSVPSLAAGTDSTSAVASDHAENAAFQEDVGNEHLVPCSAPSVVPPQVPDSVERPAALLLADPTSPLNFDANGPSPQIAAVSIPPPDFFSTALVSSVAEPATAVDAAVSAAVNTAVQQLTDLSLHLPMTTGSVPLNCSAAVSPGHNLNTILCTSPLQPSSLQATYKNALVDKSLPGIVAQGLGFSPITIDDSATAFVACQSDKRAHESNFASASTVLPLNTSPMLQLPHEQNRWHPALETDFGFNDSDYYQETLGSDELGHEEYADTDDQIYEDITDGSEGTHMKKKKDKRKLKRSGLKNNGYGERFH